MLLNTIVAGLTVPEAGELPELGEALLEMSLVAAGPEATLEGGVGVAAAVPPLWPTSSRAPATPMSSAQTTPSTTETFFQTLSSTWILL
jgi:hypothetical protein